MKIYFNEEMKPSAGLRAHLEDIDKKMESKSYAEKVNLGYPEELETILNYAVKNTVFYSNLADKNKITIKDFPVMNKITVDEHYDEILVHAYSEMRMYKSHIRGCIGESFTVAQNLKKRERHVADVKYFGAMAGYQDYTPMCYLWEKTTDLLKEPVWDNFWQLDISNRNAKNLSDYFRIMAEKKCVVLMAYSSTLETAVDYWLENLKNNSSIKIIISTSGMLTDEVKKKLHNFFGEDAAVYSRYSNSENGILGQETGNSGVYRLNWASYYFEILKMDSDEPAKDGELGRIIVTDLYNMAFPMIRYDTGDVARLHKEDNDKLPVNYAVTGIQKWR